jgi:hypothetical protein
MKARLLLALAIVTMLCVNSQPSADGGTRAGPIGTKVSGHISGATTWNVDGSPYIVIGDVFVDQYINLTLEAGTTVWFTLGTKLTVDGHMLANGTILNRVTFTSSLSQPSISDWKGIWVSETGKAIFAYSNVQYSKVGINVTGGQATVSNCTLKFHSLSAVRAGNGANVTVMDSVISSCQYDGLMYDNGSRGAALRNKEISSCQYGIVTFSEIEISHNVIKENFIGIYSYNNSGKISGNTVTNCWDGIIAFYADPVITDNLILGSLGNGTRFFFSKATFTDNRID